MAIDLGTKTVTATVQNRTWRTNIESACGTIPVVTAQRETIQTDSDGNILVTGNSVVTRSFDKVQTDSLVIDGVTITGAQMAEFIAGFIDLWETQDASNSNQA